MYNIIMDAFIAVETLQKLTILSELNPKLDKHVTVVTPILIANEWKHCDLSLCITEENNKYSGK